MNIRPYDISEQLMRELDPLDRRILTLFPDNKKPIGSWAISEMLEDCGVESSTATVGRKLNLLDRRGLTVKVGNKGRVLSEKGEAMKRAVNENAIRDKLRSNAVEATSIDKVDDLLDVLLVRKCIETECARLSAKNASEEELQRIRNMVSKHQERVMLGLDPTESAFDFHISVAEASHSRLLLRLLKLIVFEEEQLEYTMDKLLTRERGSEYVPQHAAIADAIADRNPELAASLMEKHINVLILALEEQLQMLQDIPDDGVTGT